MSSIDRKPLRIFYAAGPGNVIGTYRHWKQGREDPSQVNMTISGMFFSLCAEHGDEAYVVASCRQPGCIKDGRFRIVHRRTPFQDANGLLYHLGQTLAAMRLILSALRFRADVAVIACGSAHWFPLGILPIFGIQVIPSLHCVLWKKYRPLGVMPRLVRRLNSTFFAATAHRVLSMSRDITDQVERMTGGKHKPVIEFLPTYTRSGFEDMPAPDPAKRPFRVFYAGRIERSKGVFDLLAIARRFKSANIDDVVFDLCGDGGGLDELRRHAAADGVTDRFFLHGYCNKSVMRERFAESHVVIVPTTTDFIEGFNQVVSEAVLAGRPVITSVVCPALWYVRQAVLEVPPDDAKAYGDAILALRGDESLFRSKMAACRTAQEPFYDENQGWGAALRLALFPLRVASRRWHYAAPTAALHRVSPARRSSAMAASRSRWASAPSSVSSKVA